MEILVHVRADVSVQKWDIKPEVFLSYQLRCCIFVQMRAIRKRPEKIKNEKYIRNNCCCGKILQWLISGSFMTPLNPFYLLSVLVSGTNPFHGIKNI